jgi:putative SOS response-associated peptidase YedK
MCNLYSVTKGQQAIREFTKALHDIIGNMPSLPGVFPDYAAPIVRNTTEGRHLTMARWGMPSPAFALQNRKTDSGVTNIRNTASAHWRCWMGPANRCLVPFTSFSENEALPDGSRPPVWFAFNETRPLACFAGIWTTHTSVRELKEGEVTADLFGFLTTIPNAEVGAIHPKAMPVILTTAEEMDLWMEAPAKIAVELQRPLPDGALQIVARGTQRRHGGRGAGYDCRAATFQLDAIGSNRRLVEIGSCLCQSRLVLGIRPALRRRSARSCRSAFTTRSASAISSTALANSTSSV